MRSLVSICIMVISSQLFSQTFDTLKINTLAKGKTIELSLAKGKSFNHPSLAIWLGTKDSAFVQTLYVSKSVATGVFEHARTNSKGKWEAGEKYLPAALPVWFHNYTGSGKEFPSAKSPVADAYTGATPAGNAVIVSKTDQLANGELIVFLEVNQTWDWNEYWTNNKYPDDENYKTSCQPSLIYAATISLDDSNEIILKPLGHGHYSGKDGFIYRDISTLTTALQIFSEVKVRVK